MRAFANSLLEFEPRTGERHIKWVGWVQVRGVDGGLEFVQTLFLVQSQRVVQASTLRRKSIAPLKERFAIEHSIEILTGKKGWPDLSTIPLEDVFKSTPAEGGRAKRRKDRRCSNLPLSGLPERISNGHHVEKLPVNFLQR